tara:strand:+ start:3500 stop:3673 length:174 start_codon:yes stop_codon:yes gene_type:complete
MPSSKKYRWWEEEDYLDDLWEKEQKRKLNAKKSAKNKRLLRRGKHSPLKRRDKGESK